jgi:hypothetical protein
MFIYSYFLEQTYNPDVLKLKEESQIKLIDSNLTFCFVLNVVWSSMSRIVW